MRLRLVLKHVTNRPVPLGVIYLLSPVLLAPLNARKCAFDHWENGNGSGQHYLIKQKIFYLRRLSGVVTDGPFLLLEERAVCGLFGERLPNHGPSPWQKAPVKLTLLTQWVPWTAALSGPVLKRYPLLSTFTTHTDTPIWVSLDFLHTVREF